MDGTNKLRLQLKINGNISFPLSQIGFILPEFVAWLPLIAPLIFQTLIRLETINKSMAVGLPGLIVSGGQGGRTWSSPGRNATLLGGSGPELRRDRHLKHLSRVVQGRRFGCASVRGLTI